MHLSVIRITIVPIKPATLYAPQRNVRIPTILGLLLIILIVAGVISFFEWYTKKPTSAAIIPVPAEVAITNVSDTAFTVVWTTHTPANGAVTLLTPKHTPSTYFDDRDTGKQKTTLTHSVTIRSLTPGTLYTFRILSNGKEYTQNGNPYRVTTGATISGSGTGLEPAYGTVRDTQGSPVDGAVVLVTLQQGQTLSTLTSPSGTWLLSLGFARNEMLTKYLDGRERLTESIRIFYQDQESDAITDTLNDAPVPTMILGKTYDFRKQQANAQKTPLLSEVSHEKPAVLGDATEAKPGVSNAVRLTLPAQNASLTTSLPLIQGTGVPGKKVSVVLGITNPASGTTSVGGDGIWRYTPTKPLGNGRQSVTVTTSDAQGKAVALTHTFTVLKSGTQVLGEATPSATLTLSPTPVATESATPSATPTPVLEGEPVPTSGTTLPTLLILLLATGLFSIGFISLKKA